MSFIYVHIPLKSRIIFLTDIKKSLPFIGRYYSDILARISFLYSWIFYKKNAQFFD